MTPQEAQQTLESVANFVAGLRTDIVIKDAWVLQNHLQKLAQFIAAQIPPQAP